MTKVNWTKYKLVFQALSPVSIGYNKLGFVKLTRHYIPAKNIWAATVQYITEAKYPEQCERKNYAEIEQLIETEIRFSYFFVKCNDKIYKPGFIEGKGLIYGNGVNGISIEEFQSKFIYSYASTAIAPESATAQDDMLHEVEYINWRIEENGELQDIFFSGYIWVRNGEEAKIKSELDNLKYKNISVGGERAYGFGRLKLISIDYEKEMEFEIENNNPVIPLNEVLNDSRLEAHMEYKKDIKFYGLLEPVVGREWCKKNPKHGAGRKISTGKVYVAPGTKLINPPKEINLIPEGYYFYKECLE